MGNTSQPVITFCIYVLVTLMKGWLLEVQHILGGLKCCSSVGATVFCMCCSWATSRILCYFNSAFSHSSLSCFQVLSSLKSVARPSSQGCSQGEWYTWLWLPLCFQVIFCALVWRDTSFLFLGVGKGNGTDLKVQVIMRKQVVLECVCATQGNCKVSTLWNWQLSASVTQLTETVVL